MAKKVKIWTLHKIIQKGVRILTFVYFDLSSSTLEIINQIVTEHWSTQEYFFPPLLFFEGWGGGGVKSVLDLENCHKKDESLILMVLCIYGVFFRNCCFALEIVNFIFCR